MKGFFAGAFALATLLASAAADHLVRCDEEAPCLNGGSCSAQNYCLCLPSFYGSRCSKQIFAAVDMSGSQEATPVNSPYTGMSVVMVDTITMGATMSLEATVINATAAHIHQAPVGVAGPVRFPFTVTNPVPNSPSLYATITATINMTHLELFRTEMYYANIHTAANPAGEIRGQLLPWDACAQDPCMNGGTCFSNGVLPVCLCPDNYAGAMCDIEVCGGEENPDDVCIRGSCNADGSCQCTPGFTGESCENVPPALASCETGPCQNGGTCTPLDAEDNTGASCACVSGFTGDYCQLNQCTGDYCESSASQTLSAMGWPISSQITFTNRPPATDYTNVRLTMWIRRYLAAGVGVKLVPPANVPFPYYVSPQTMYDEETQITEVTYTYRFRLGLDIPLESASDFTNGNWTLILIDPSFEGDSTFLGWSIETDLDNDCVGVTCSENLVCVDGFKSHTCIITPPPCNPDTCIRGYCDDVQAYCVCDDTETGGGEYCAAFCTSDYCLLDGINAPIAAALPSTRATFNYENSELDTIPAITQFYVSVNISHARPGDLIIRIISPNGTVIPLSQNNGGTNAGLFRDYFVWSDSFSLTLASVDSENYDQKYARPLVPFRTLAGESIDGTWVLDIVDTVGQVNGSLHGFYIGFDTVDQCQTDNTCGEDLACIDLFNSVSCRLSSVCDVPSCSNQNTAYGQDIQSVITFENLAVTSLPSFFKMRVRISLVGSDGNPISPSVITASLTSPAGTTVTLANESDDILGLFVRVNFQSPVTANVTSSGYQREPVDSYAAFVGQNPNGNWVLRLLSSQGGPIVVQLSSWSIELDLVNDCTPDACQDGTCTDGLFEPICDCAEFNTPDCRPPTSCSPGTYGSAEYPRGVLNTTVFGTCTFGFVGVPFARCLANGTVVVVRDCISADTICPAENYGPAFFPDTFVTREATGTCEAGWIGSPRRTCEVTGWSPNVRDACQRVMCASVTEGNAVWPEANADSTQLVFGTCVAGFSGNPTRFCNPNGGSASFSAISSPCVPNCPAQSSYGFASWPSTAASATATGTCAAGYTGSPQRRCTRDGVWETNIQFHCQIARCGPVNIDNAEWPLTNPGSATYGTCNAGFVGRPFRTCLPSGSFGAVQNPCVSASATCPAQTAYAFADWTATTVGQTATGTCISGYSGSPRRTCLPGGWSSSVIDVCTRNICPATTDAVHSFPEMKSNTRGYGTCVTGSGRPWRQCLADGTFGPIQNPCS